ncbi:3'(2'),5'-bisphosphate nucleotidase CysQ [Deferribacter thermophilus]|uniref:3'(2'),5'-bisphosphate nucleotidase CysQ family protein n=1 Tax=Deferribacter thermophilus TaxID=53573 RepID=UPI003C227D14
MYKKELNIGDYSFNINDILKIALEAGKEVMKIYEKDFSINYKDDKSPLTEADKVSHEIICDGLEKVSSLAVESYSHETLQFNNSTTPQLHYSATIPILSEEGKDIPFEVRKDWEYFWMVDPLDGTKEFIKKNGEFTINIALIHNNEPIFGVVYAPAIDTMYFTDDQNAYKLEKDKIYKLPTLHLKPKTQHPIFTIVASKSHLNDETKDFIDKLSSTIQNPQSKINFISKGSSLKLCMVAEGKADIYPRLAPTMEWDTAAADAVVRKSGRMTYEYNNSKFNDLCSIIVNNPKSNTQHPTPNTQHLVLTPLKYNKKDLLNPWFVVC